MASTLVLLVSTLVLLASTLVRLVSTFVLTNSGLVLHSDLRPVQTVKSGFFYNFFKMPEKINIFL